MKRKFPTIRLYLLLCLVLAVTSLSWAWSREAGPGKLDPDSMLRLPPPPVLEAAKAKVDTLNLYGGPGTLEGKFQTADGLPDPQGWVAIDEKASEVDSYWNMSEYEAENLDPAVEDNRAWWCGYMFPECPGDEIGGYGNDWNQSLTWRGTVADPSLPATVTLTGVMNLDTEPNYDYLHLRFETTAGAITLETYDGRLVCETIVHNFGYLPGEFLNGNEILISFNFESDFGWSDEDCLWPTVGAAQIDNLQVTISQAGYPDIVSPVETCQPGDPSTWFPGSEPGCGNFGHLLSDLDDIDPNVDNHSPQWTFIDDGIEPATGGTLCTTWCYGPGGFVLNYTGGLCGEGFEIINSVRSPVINLPRGNFKSLLLSLDMYLHVDFASDYNGWLFWQLETTADPSGQSDWQAYDNYQVYYNEGLYSRSAFEVKREDLVPGACLARIKIGVMVNNMWPFGPYTDITPAPYFDNVRLQAVGVTGKPPKEAIAEAVEISCSPNPFNPAVTIKYAMAKAGDLDMRIYDLQGRLVATLIDGPVAQGPGQVTWRGTDQNGRPVAAGTYFCRTVAADFDRAVKLQLVK